MAHEKKAEKESYIINKKKVLKNAEILYERTEIFIDVFKKGIFHYPSRLEIRWWTKEKNYYEEIYAPQNTPRDMADLESEKSVTHKTIKQVKVLKY